MEGNDIDPEPEPLNFEFNTDDVPADMGEVMLHIKQLGEKLLYHWKTFPVILPASITETQQGEGREEQGVISFKDLFIAPTFDELEEVALDAKGQPKKLDDAQLASVRQNGEFEVRSNHFPSQVHRWRLSVLLQKGRERAHETLLNDMALALRLLVITARNRFHSHFFSLSEALKSFKLGLWQILDLLIGMPSTTPGGLFDKLQEEHSRFLVAELHVKPSCKTEWINFCEFLKDKCNHSDTDKCRTTDFHPPPVPYKFLTPKGSDIDLRLFNIDLLNKCMDELKHILEKESKGWYIKYKDKLITDLKGQNLSYDEIAMHVNKAIQEEYLRRVFNAVLRSERLDALQPKIGVLLVEQAQSALVMSTALEGVREKLLIHEKEHKNLLIRNYTVKSRIRAWMNERLQEFKNDFIEQNQWRAHDESLAECRRQSLDQAVYFLQRDLTFIRDREPVLKKELGKVKNPTRVFSFSYRIWLPSSWVVSRQLHGETDVIPTAIVQSRAGVPSSIVRRESGERASFTVEKYLRKKTSTRYPFWRWVNYFHRTLSWSWNAMFWLGLVIPWCSPVSLRALFFPKSFKPDLELSQINGSLYPKESSLTNTLWTRLHGLWQHVRHSRTQFESEPDTGFLGKSCTRFINQVWNYVIKGALGSVALVLVMTPLCLGVSLLSMAAAVTAPLWMILVTLLAHVAAVLFYDFDRPASGVNAIMYLFEAIFYRLLFQGMLQPIGALLAALVALPIAAFFVMLAGLVRRGCRAVWDVFMYHAVIKSRARVPSKDGFIARRTAGPGLASNYFFQVKPEQALAAVEARVELHEVVAWMENKVKVIEQPKEEFKMFVGQCFGPFSAALVKDGVYKELERESQDLTKELRKTVEERRKKLHTGLTDDIRCRVKLSGRELKVTIAQTAKMLEVFYPRHVLRRMSDEEQEGFWEKRHLELEDWQGLATQLLTEIFSSTFLTPLEDSDNCFKLEVEHLNLSRYIDMLKSAEFRDDLDVVSTVHTPKGDIDVDAPYMEIFTFSPHKERVRYAEDMFYRDSGSRRRPWKKRTVRFREIEKLEIPLPVAHPGVIAVLINNRDNDQDPLDLEDPVCRRLLRAAEGLPYVETWDANSADVYGTEVSTPDHTTNSDVEGGLYHLAEQESCAFSDDMMRSTTPDSLTGAGLGGAGEGMTLPVRRGAEAATADLGAESGTTSEETSGDDDVRTPSGDGDFFQETKTGSEGPGSDPGADTEDTDADPVSRRDPREVLEALTRLTAGDVTQGSAPDQVRSRVVYSESEADTSCVVDMEDEGEEGEEVGEGPGPGEGGEEEDQEEEGAVGGHHEDSALCLEIEDDDADADDDDEFNDAEESLHGVLERILKGGGKRSGTL